MVAAMALALTTLDALGDAIARARSVTASAYRLPPAMEASLAAAAVRGAAVDVVLASRAAGTYDERLGCENAAAAERLRAAGARVRLAPGVHLKAAVVDDAGFLDDRNFAARGASIVVRDDDAADVARLREAIAAPAGAAPAAPPGAALALTKTAALAGETAAIRYAAPGPVAVATESFDFGEIEAALRRRLEGGDAVRLLVDGREAAGRREALALRAMRRLGAEVRVARSVDKVALTGDAAWCGSANATYAGPDVTPQSDWGVVVRDVAIREALRDRFDAAWAAATPQPASG